MKKVLFAVALMFGALTVSAQQSVVKEAKSKKGNPVEAAKIIEAALTNPETANDPNTWKLAGDFQKAIYDAENEKMYLSAVDKSKVADTTKMYNSLAKLFEYYLKCDEVEQAQVASGALKKAKLRKKNADALKAVRMNLAAGGGDAYNAGNYKAALKLFGLFVDVAEAPMFAEDPAVSADTLTSLYAAYASLAANMIEDKENVIKYGNIGKEHKDEGYRSLMCMAEVYAGDTIKWLEVIKEGAEKFPAQNYFVGNLMDYYMNKGMVDEGLAQINELLAAKEDPYYLYIKGVLLNEKKQYDEVMSVCDKIIAIGGDLAAEAYTLKGGCYFWQGQAIVEENSTLQIDDPKYNTNEAKIKDLFEQAKPLYEKAKELEPDNKSLWGNILLSIYWKLNSPEYSNLEKELGY